LVGPQISRRQFVGVIASGAWSTIQADRKRVTQNEIDTRVGVNLLFRAAFDDESGRVKVSAEVAADTRLRHLLISYNVSILAEMPTY